MLFLALLAGVARASHVVSLQLSPVPDHGVAVLEDEAGHLGTFAMQRSGLVLVFVAPSNGSFVLRLTSQTHRFPLVSLRVDDGRVTGRVAERPLPLSAEGAFVVAAVGPEVLYAERVPFSWYGLASSPMVLMGGVTIVMMGLMQLMLAGVDLEDIKRELRSEPRADDSAPTAAGAASAVASAGSDDDEDDADVEDDEIIDG